MNITSGQFKFLHHSLQDESLQDLTTVRLAREDLNNGILDGAILHLSKDLDKIRPSHPDFCRMVQKMYEELMHELEPGVLNEFQEDNHEVVDPWLCRGCSTLFEPALNNQCPNCLGTDTLSATAHRQVEYGDDICLRLRGKAEKWIEKRVPSAPEELKAAFVNSVVYGLTRKSLGTLGPSARELYARSYLDQMSLSTFDRVTEGVYRMVFRQPLSETHLAIYDSGITKDDCKEEIKAMEALRVILCIKQEGGDEDEGEYLRRCNELDKYREWLDEFPEFESFDQKEDR